MRDLAKIATRYYKTELIWDLMALVPLNLLFKFKYSRFLILVKCVRSRETAVMFDISNFRMNFKRLTDRYHEWAMKNESDEDEGYEDKIKLMEILYFHSGFKVFRITIQIVATTYLVAMMFYMTADIILESEFKKMEDG